ncbi:hypothetical protein GIB67_023891 [Kingdonia uniflora]|uniref:Uncharacterized protein n=1 Tax=Kingdonia uniflora TaxID=39325 RepID=A0A7J7NG24_9MAGN|nr:hypothetical protein GIB67_023891 [Kingdonia uniflora]
MTCNKKKLKKRLKNIVLTFSNTFYVLILVKKRFPRNKVVLVGYLNLFSLSSLLR